MAQKKGKIEEVLGIVCFEDIDVCFDLVLDHDMKVLELMTSFRFVFH